MASAVLREPAELSADASSTFWQSVHRLELCEAVSGGRPNQPTALRLAWSAEELRVLFEVQDEHIWATHRERDAALYEEEVVEIFLDPLGDLESYFELEVNPLNAILDLVLRRNRSGYARDFGWDCEGLRTCVSTTPIGWNAEFAIPFRALVPELPTIGARWRANFCRIDRPRSGPWELSAFSPTGRPTFHTPERFGVLAFVA